MVILAILLILAAWVVVRAIRVPRRPEQDRAERFRDPGELGTRRGPDIGGG
jgi:hypothetical protein